MTSDISQYDLELADHAVGCFAQFEMLRQAGQLCDVVLQAGREKSDRIPAQADRHDRFLAHKLVLASVSAYFSRLFSGVWSADLGDGSLPVVHLPSIEPEVLCSVLRAAYTGRLQVSATTIQHVMECADYLGMATVMDSCHRHLKQQLSTKNCLTTLQLAAHFESPDLFEQSSSFVRQHFSEAVREDIEGLQLAALSQDVLRKVLNAETLQAASELEVAQVVLSWLEAHASTLAADMPQLLRTVRLPPRQLRSEIESGELELHSSDCRRAVLSHLRDVVAAQPRLPPVCPRQKLPVMLMAAGGHDPAWRSIRNTEVYNPKDDAWEAGPLLPQGYSFATGCVTGSGAYIVAGATHGNSVARLASAAAASWQQLPQCNKPRLHTAATACCNELYVLGGRAGATSELRSTEVFDLAAMKWRLGPQMVWPRTALAAATLHDQLFAVGGQSGKRVHATVERCDVSSGQFQLLKNSMHCERKYTSCSSMAGRLIVCGGMNASRTRLSSVEAFDPREGRWTLLPPMQTARASCGTAVLADDLYVVAGSGENDTIFETAECYSAAAGKWRPIAPLGLARSNLALLPLCS